MSRTRDAVREEIILVAAVCFGELGYRATTLDTIAAKAGVSKVTLYKHVASKEDLLWAVFERTLASFREGLARTMEWYFASKDPARLRDLERLLTERGLHS